MTPYEALYGRKCRSPICWGEVGKRKLLGPEIVQITYEKIALIKEWLKTAQSRQKRYADNRRRDLEFEVSDRVFFKISPTKVITRFGKKGKLCLRYIGPLEVLERVGNMTYRLALPPELANIHNVFHVSLMRSYQPDPFHVSEYEPIPLKEGLTYVEQPIGLLDQRIQVLRNKKIPLVQVQWQYHSRAETKWEREDEICEKYPHLLD
ncbi:uncharacterized protein LOC110006918 [Amborella trichopoda]|uniref:uncharacterized protein LOC110006918 n=1 Tax=Amborella trichopoda TaxID=13333 RepID=UPI0009BE7B13|nr:uncharacterized protein LOC110006918 [Amborella trichopoda]|eukprot:XP_020520657.1 uncharacterized protein LOC110006918 [Amborella trichopoda]